MNIKKKKAKRGERTFWQFALVNGRLVEVFFCDGRIMGHCYVEAKEYKTREEKRWIAEDTQRLQLTYGKEEYRDMLVGKKLPRARPIQLKKGKRSGPFKNVEEFIRDLRNKKTRS